MPSRPEIAAMRKSRSYRKAAAKVLAQSRTCWICGRDGADTADHVIPLSEGGDLTSLLNLRPAHRSCNSRRGANLPTVTNLQSSRTW